MSSTVQQQTTIVFGYMCGVSNKTATALSPAAHLDDSGNLDAALGICQLIKMQSTFSEGILLKCIDNQRKLTTNNLFSHRLIFNNSTLSISALHNAQRCRQR